MRTLAELPPASSRRAKTHQYDKLFDGRIWEIAPADVPHTDLSTLRATLIRRARRSGWTLKTRLRHDPPRLVVQRIITPRVEVTAAPVAEAVE